MKIRLTPKVTRTSDLIVMNGHAIARRVRQTQRPQVRPGRKMRR